MAKRFPPAGIAELTPVKRAARTTAIAVSVLLVLLMVVSVAHASGHGANPAPEPSKHGPIVLIQVDGSINPAVAEFVEQALDAAQRQDARALIIELDTPGGLLTTMRRLVKDLLGAPLPVIVYVAPSGASAASAGMFVTIAANLAAMAPGTTIGAAHPIEMGQGEQGGVMGQKLENFAVSLARTIAQQRGRNESWVEHAVRQSASIGEREALTQHVVDIVAKDVPDLLSQASGRQVLVDGRKQLLELKDVAIVRLEMTLKERLVDKLSDPNLVYLLLMAGMLGLYFEFAHPGVYAPGIIGTICLLLALTSFQILPISYTGLLLLLLGVGLLTAEAFLPSYGVVGIGGLVAFILGSLFLIDTTQTNLAISRAAITGVSIVMLVAVLGLAWAVAQRRRPPVTGPEGLVGAVGEIRQPVGPGVAGWIFIHGELWRARSDQALDIGTQARVKAVRGMELEVQGLSQQHSASSV